MRLRNLFSDTPSEPDKEMPPVEYIRRKRQKYVRIRVKPDKVIVSAPVFTPIRQMERFLGEKKSWVLKTLRKMESGKHAGLAAIKFKEEMLLFEGNWTPFMVCRATSNKDIGAELSSGTITFKVSGQKDTKESIVVLFREFGADLLRDRFHETARRSGFSFNRLSIRNQRTRWGSCSAKRNINLNWRLIKCPRFVQEYIFIHELCHIRYMNHSKQFWNLVESHFPERKKAEKWLRDYGPVAFQEP